MKPNDFTVTQMLLAAGMAKRVKRSSLVRVLDISESYYTKQSKDNSFMKLVDSFRMMPKDKDLEEYKGMGTLLMMVGKYIYTFGDNYE